MKLCLPYLLGHYKDKNLHEYITILIEAPSASCMDNIDARIVNGTSVEILYKPLSKLTNPSSAFKCLTSKSRNCPIYNENHPKIIALAKAAYNLETNDEKVAKMVIILPFRVKEHFLDATINNVKIPGKSLFCSSTGVKIYKLELMKENENPFVSQNACIYVGDSSDKSKGAQIYNMDLVKRNAQPTVSKNSFINLKDSPDKSILIDTLKGSISISSVDSSDFELSSQALAKNSIEEIVEGMEYEFAKASATGISYSPRNRRTKNRRTSF